MSSSDHIPGGYVALARHSLKSSIWQSPPTYWKLWCWCLMRANHAPYKDLSRGQFTANIDIMRKAIAYKVGYRTETPTKDVVKGFLRFAREASMIATTRTPHGLIITVLNYDRYQTPANYENTNEATPRTPSRVGYKQECLKEQKGNSSKGLQKLMIFEDAKGDLVDENGHALPGWSAEERAAKGDHTQYPILEEAVK